MKTVCIDARLLIAPGIGTYLKNLFSHLKQSSWKWFALIHPEEKDKIAAWDYIEPIIISSKVYSLREQLELSWKIPRVDLFWSLQYNIPCLPIRSRKRLVSIHDVFHLAFASTLQPLEKLYAKCMIQAAMRFSDHVITCSLFSKAEIQAYTGIRTRPLSVIPYGVDPEIFHPYIPMEKTDCVMKKYHIERPFILYVGSFKAHKNLKGLLAAFSLLVKRKSDIQLVIVGEGQGMRHCQDVKQLCIAHPGLQEKVRCVGHVCDEDLPHFYRGAQLFVFPSFYEGFGFPPLEAMSSGCPTVIARAGAMPEVCGQGALYVDPHSPDQIAELLEELLEEEPKRKELSQKGVERSRHFCWKRCAEEHHAVIERLISA